MRPLTRIQPSRWQCEANIITFIWNDFFNSISASPAFAYTQSIQSLTQKPLTSNHFHYSAFSFSFVPNAQAQCRARSRMSPFRVLATKNKVQIKCECRKKTSDGKLKTTKQIKSAQSIQHEHTHLTIKSFAWHGVSRWRRRRQRLLTQPPSFILFARRRSLWPIALTTSTCK